MKKKSTAAQFQESISQVHCKEALEEKGLQAQADNRAVAEQMAECETILKSACDFWQTMIERGENFRQGSKFYLVRSQEVLARMEPRLAELEAEIERRRRR